MSDRFDIAIVGAGMAGASLAAAIGNAAHVVLLEAEDFPGYHTTGRSAAFWEECYGGPEIVPLTLASGPFLRENGFLNKRGAFYLARSGADDAVDAFMERFAGTGVTIERLGRAAIEAAVPGIRQGWDHAVHEPHCADIDVAALHQFYLTRARQSGTVLKTAARVQAAQRIGGSWQLDCGNAGQVHADLVVNCAGAWADQLAQLCGARPLGITPYRRTMVQLRSDPPAPSQQPLVLDLNGAFYFKPEHGRLWLSPHDETPCAPCDAAPEDIDVALAIDRLERVVDWQVLAVERKWAGLRSFASDRRPVYGFDVRCEGFFWCAGQGGFGIQTAPAGSQLAAQLLLGSPADAITETLDRALYAPDRFS